jgi:hypothetical protein
MLEAGSSMWPSLVRASCSKADLDRRIWHLPKESLDYVPLGAVSLHLITFSGNSHKDELQGICRIETWSINH